MLLKSDKTVLVYVLKIDKTWVVPTVSTESFLVLSWKIPALTQNKVFVKACQVHGLFKASNSCLSNEGAHLLLVLKENVMKESEYIYYSKAQDSFILPKLTT